MTAVAAETRDALLARYGGAIPEDLAPANEVIDLLYRHRSVRAFAADPVGDAVVGTVVAAAQSAATSSNLQSWSVIEVRDAERKSAAATLAGDQQFIRDAPVFLVFVADWARNRAIAEARDEPAEGIRYVDTTLTGFVDAAIAAQNAVVAAESLGLGTVYVGSVRNNPEALAELLGLPQGAFPVVGLALGHPDPDDAARVKPRLPQRIVRHRETYADAADGDVAAYEAAVTAYYATQGQPRGWIDAVLRRVRDAASLHGRAGLRGALERRGLASR